jgi:transposase
MKENNDARTSPEGLYERRKQVIRLSKKGYGPMTIAEMTGLSWGAVNNAIKAYAANGCEALKPKKRGRKSGTKRLLTPAQEKEVQRLICDKRPEQMKMHFALWTREAVRQLIKERFSVDLAVRSVGEYLSRWGDTPQKPIKRAYEQQPEAVQKWLDEEYPLIAQKARVEGAEIHWADETAVVNTDVRGRSYSPRGQTPETRAVWGRRESFSMISSVTNQGKCRWMMIDGAFNSERFIEFMTSLIKDIDCKVFVILDNLKVHHSKPVKAWLKDNENDIEAFYLPSYSPELNPDERLNADLKHAITTQVPARTRERLKKKTTEHMNMIQASPQRVMSYFQDPVVRYAANHN